MNTATPTLSENLSNFFVSLKLFQIADSGPNGDNSCVFLPLAAMEIQGLKDGDLVHITCPARRKDTLALLFLSQSTAEPQAILMNHICRKNLAAQVGDIVNIKLYNKAVDFTKIVLRKIGGYAPYATPENH